MVFYDTIRIEVYVKYIEVAFDKSEAASFLRNELYHKKLSFARVVPIYLTLSHLSSIVFLEGACDEEKEYYKFDKILCRKK